MQLLPSPDGAQPMAQAMAQARLGSFAAGWPASAGPRPAIMQSSWSLVNCRPPAQLLVARTRRTAGDVPPRPNCAASAPAGPDWGSLRDCAPRGRRGHRAPSATRPAGWGADSGSHRLPAAIVQGGTLETPTQASTPCGPARPRTPPGPPGPGSPLRRLGGDAEPEGISGPDRPPGNGGGVCVRRRA